MPYYTIRPPRRLAGCVKYFWVHEHNVSGEEGFTYISTADSSPKMVFHYGGAFDEMNASGECIKSFASGIQGQTQEHGTFVTREVIGTFGVYLFPWAISRLFTIPAAELTNHVLDMDDVVGVKGGNLEERIMMAQDNVERVRVMSDFLEGQLNRDSEIDSVMRAAIRYITSKRGLVNIEALAQQSHLSHRQFGRRFKESSGFSPKGYARIVRFEAALQKCSNESRPLTEIAYDCGYYDQSHFNREFKEFSGHHPTSYFSAVDNR